MAKKKIDAFKGGAVLVQFKKDLPYFSDKDGSFKTPITTGKLKEESQFKKGEKSKLEVTTAGKLAAAGYVDILDEQKNVINTKEVAKEK